MTVLGENGIPETPDWVCDPRPCDLDIPATYETAGRTVVSAETFDRILAELDEPPRISAPLRRRVLERRFDRGLSPLIELGDN